MSATALITAYLVTSRESNQSSRSPRSSMTWSVPTPAASSSRRSEEHTSELQSQSNLVCRLLLEKKKYQRIPSAGETLALLAHAAPQPTAVTAYQRFRRA